MKTKIHTTLFPIMTLLLFVSGNSGKVLEETPAIMKCTMDVSVQNNISTTIDYVQFNSSVDTKTFYNISGNGGSDGSAFEWQTSEGFTITIKLGSSSGTGSIRIFNEHTLVHCSNFNNPTLACVIELGPHSLCPGAYYVYIESSSC